MDGRISYPLPESLFKLLGKKPLVQSADRGQIGLKIEVAPSLKNFLIHFYIRPSLQQSTFYFPRLGQGESAAAGS